MQQTTGEWSSVQVEGSLQEISSCCAQMCEYATSRFFFFSEQICKRWKFKTAAEMWLTDGYEAAWKGDEEEKQQFWPEAEHFVGVRVWSL